MPYMIGIGEIEITGRRSDDEVDNIMAFVKKCGCYATEYIQYETWESVNFMMGGKYLDEDALDEIKVKLKEMGLKFNIEVNEYEAMGSGYYYDTDEDEVD